MRFEVIELADFNVEKGKVYFIGLLKREDKYREFMGLVRAGKHKEAGVLAEQVVAKYRKELNNELGITGGEGV